MIAAASPCDQPWPKHKVSAARSCGDSAPSSRSASIAASLAGRGSLDVATSSFPASRSRRRAVRRWLGFVVLTLFALVLVGGATRLTESGLSITEWKPIHGVIPPMNAAEWQEEFELYKRIPQYEQLNSDMTVESFKSIFWWEWAHRFLARSIGLVFALPLLFFWLTARIERRLRWSLFGVLALGGFQGFIGWWMVSSGLTKLVSVSQYRLATHLVIACLIFAACTWIMRGLSPHSDDPPPTESARTWAAAIACMAIVVFASGNVVGWPLAGVMVPAAALGGWSGVWAARRVPQPVIRGLVVAVGIALTIYYFVTG